ncbi:hypothetical protein pb186bvf_003657 [Paramecium bursaria]
MDIKEKLRLMRCKTNLYKLQTPQIFKDNFITKQPKDWLKRRSDITDYFNYGFNDATLTLYNQRLNKMTDSQITNLQRDYLSLKSNWKNIFEKALKFQDSIPQDYGGFAIPSVAEALPITCPTNFVDMLFSSEIDMYNDQEEQQMLFNNEILLNIQYNYRQYIDKQIQEDYFDFECLLKDMDTRQQLPDYILQLLAQDRKKQKHEKKKSKKEKKAKKEKKKNKKKIKKAAKELQEVSQNSRLTQREDSQSSLGQQIQPDSKIPTQIVDKGEIEELKQDTQFEIREQEYQKEMNNSSRDKKEFQDPPKENYREPPKDKVQEPILEPPEQIITRGIRQQRIKKIKRGSQLDKKSHLGDTQIQLDQKMIKSFTLLDFCIIQNILGYYYAEIILK